MMRSHRKVLGALLGLAGIISTGTAAQASIVVSIIEDTVANKVTMSYAGSVDTTQPGFMYQMTGTMGMSSYVSGAGLSISPTYPEAQFYKLTSPFAVGFISSFKKGTFVAGDPFAYDSNGGYEDQLFLPAGYVSGTEISGSSIYDGSFNSLGINTTPLTMNLPGNQIIEVNFTTVPEPASLSLLGLGAMALLRRRR